ncbi:MAG: 30S ribosome-binding factor RbfA [Pseudomonadota bacterium]
MKGNRIAKVNRMLQVHLGEMIPAIVRDPRVAEIPMIAITSVRVSPDLRYATIYVSMFGAEEAVVAAVKGLNNASGFLRAELGRRIALRHTPELHFVRDETMAEAARIDDILREISEEDG